MGHPGWNEESGQGNYFFFLGEGISLNVVIKVLYINLLLFWNWGIFVLRFSEMPIYDNLGETIGFFLFKIVQEEGNNHSGNNSIC